MTEIIFGYLSKVGFTHPLHPAFTHIPMGMVLGAMVFRLVSFLPKLKSLAKTGYHCVILGLVGIGPTAFAGYLDWMHKYEGKFETLIVIKMVLAALLAILMLVTIIMDDPENPRLDKKTGFYFLMVILAIGLGFSGGELLYG